MNSMVFDTYAAATRFKAAGFSEAQIDALVDITRETTALPDISTLATKSDIAQLAAATKNDIAQLAAATKNDIAQLAAATKNDIAQLDAKIDNVKAELKGEIGRVQAELKALIVGVEAKIASTQVQTISIVLAGMAAMLAFSTLIVKLGH